MSEQEQELAALVAYQERDRLAMIEARLARIEKMLSDAHRALMPVLENPGRLLAKIMGGGK